MGVSLSLFRVANSLLKIPPDQRISELNEKVVLPFGSCANIVERLCSVSGFSRNLADGKTLPLAWINCWYQPGNIYGGILFYRIWDDPVSCITVKRANVEDFLPIIYVLKDLELFLVLNPVDSKLTSSHEFKYSMEEWFQKKSAEDARNFKY